MCARRDECVLRGSVFISPAFLAFRGAVSPAVVAALRVRSSSRPSPSREIAERDEVVAVGVVHLLRRHVLLGTKSNFAFSEANEFAEEQWRG
ncbi:hypothetical protein MRX96_030858 [Rhipicephalus microplus]